MSNSTVSKTEKRRSFDLAWIAVLAVVLLTVAIRVRLLQIPLERDEGEYAYAGQLMLQGLPPYVLAYNMKLPGIYAAYAAIMAVFGQTIAGIHLGLLVVNIAAIVMVFVLGRRLFGSLAGVVAAASYAVFAIQPGVFGVNAHATHFVVLFALAGILLLLREQESKSDRTLFVSGLMLGLSFLMKQPGALYILFGGLYLIRADMQAGLLTPRARVRRLAVFASGAALPYAFACFALWQMGVFPSFWFWTYEYARVYGSEQSLAGAWLSLTHGTMAVAGPMLLLWVLALVGLTALWWNRDARRHAFFALGLLAFSMLAVSVGLYFRGHYFVMLFPALSLVVGLGVSSCASLPARSRFGRAPRLLPIALFLVAVVLPVCRERQFFFRMSPAMASCYLYNANPFPESMAIGKYIEEHSTPNDRVAVLGSEPQIYFYSHRRSATGYIYTYALTEHQPFARAMQREMVAQIERAKPKFLVLVDVPSSWMSTVGYRPATLQWSEGYAARYYDLVGLVNIDANHGRGSASSDSREQYSVRVFERKPR